MKKVKIGLIGLGFMGTTHLDIHRNNPQAEVVAIADVDAAKRAGDISKVCGNIGGGDNSKPLNLAGIKTYADAMELIADPAIDMVDICVPTPDHTKYILAALAAGKHVFSEKPLCRTHAEMLQIGETARKAKTFFNVGMCIRAWPEYRHAYEMVQSGAIGKVRSAKFTRLSPSVAGNSWENWFMDSVRSGGALLDLHLHDTDAVRYFFGRPCAVTSVGAKGVVSDAGVDYVVTSYSYCDIPLVVAEGGWAASKQVPFEMSFQIIGEKATLKLDGSGYHVYWTDGRTEAPAVADPKLPTGWHQELVYFVACILDGVKPEKYQTLDQILDSYAMILAEQQSVDTGKTVEVKYV